MSLSHLNDSSQVGHTGCQCCREVYEVGIERIKRLKGYPKESLPPPTQQIPSPSALLLTIFNFSDISCMPHTRCTCLCQICPV